MNRADKNWAYFQKPKHFKNQSYQKVGMAFISKIRFQKNAAEDFENQIFEIFEENC